MEFARLLEIVADEPVFESGLLLAGGVNPGDVRKQLSRWTKAGQLYQLRRGLYALAQEGVRERKSLKDVYEMARRRMDPAYGKYPIYEHCMPFDVSRAYDEASGIRHPRIWTAKRDVEMWKTIA